MGRRKQSDATKVSNKAVMYARVSSKEQEKEGYSIPEQKALLWDYAKRKGLDVAEVFVDVETAKEKGRTSYGRMFTFLKKNSTVRNILVEKTDRLYRNLRDWVDLDELDLTIHLVKENVVLTPESRSHERFVHGLNVLLARRFIDNLSEETKKGMSGKVAAGGWPHRAPIGYLNAGGDHDKRWVEPDDELAPLITRLFEVYATGKYSVKEAGEVARGLGLRYRSGKPVTRGYVHKILRNPFYAGDFIWKGELHHGDHAPLVSRDLFDKVQRILDERAENKHRKGKRDFAFARMIRCGYCGCSVVGELKRKKAREYVYYHCTDFHGGCEKPYHREEKVTDWFADQLRRLHFNDEVLDLVRDALKASHETEQAERDDAIARLRADLDRARARVHTAYRDKLDGRIDAAFYDELAAEAREEQEAMQQEIDRWEAADQSYLDAGVRLLELAQNAPAAFKVRDSASKRDLLGFVVSNCTMTREGLAVTFRQPFDLIAETTDAARKRNATEGDPDGASDIWLRRTGSNRRPGG
jgi:site-specific DNA recombinase